MDDGAPRLSPRLERACATIENPGLPRGEPEQVSEFLPTLFVALVTALVVVSASTGWVDSTLADGSVKNNSRWAHLAAAYEHIASQPGVDVIIIGSSRLYSGIDGSCLDAKTNHSGTSHWNLAVRGDFPYMRLPETDVLVRANAQIVVIEAGPNTFSPGIGTRKNRLRWEVESLSMEFDGDESWWPLVRAEDEVYLATSIIDRYRISQSFTPESSDELAHRFLLLGDSRAMEWRDGMMPDQPGSPEWISALKDPPRNDEVNLSSEEMAEYIEVLTASTFWQASSADHHNRRSLEHIIESLESNGTKVILYAPAVHPDFLDAIPAGFWDEFNMSRESLTVDGRPYVDDTFESWNQSSFTDPVHFTESGRERLCKEMGRAIDSSLHKVV